MRQRDFGVDLIKFFANIVDGEFFKRVHRFASHPGRRWQLLPGLFCQFLPKVFPQRIEKNVFDISMKKVIMASFGGALGLANQGPICGLIASAGKTIFLNKGFQQV